MSALDEGDVFDPEVFVSKPAPVEPEMLRLRGGVRFLASELIVPVYEHMNRVLDVIQAENDRCEAGAFRRRVH